MENKDAFEYGWKLLAKCTSEMVKDLGLRQPYEKNLYGNIWDYLENDKDEPLPPAFFQPVSVQGSESRYKIYNDLPERFFFYPWCSHAIEVPYYDPLLKMRSIEVWCTKYEELCNFRRYLENGKCNEPRNRFKFGGNWSRNDEKLFWTP